MDANMNKICVKFGPELSIENAASAILSVGAPKGGWVSLKS
jgi:hypothetical protein